MKRAEIQDWLYSKVCDALSTGAGFDRSMLERSRMAWIVRARMHALQIPDEATYAAYLSNSAAEIQELVEHAVVPETRFFRDTAVFEHLRIWLAQLAVTSDEPIRVLSAPCSTGQEAYSAAALMLEAGVPPERFTIDAIDISLHALGVAEKGVYPAGAFRHLSKELQRACGVLQGDQLRVLPVLRERIRFMQCNLATANALQHLEGAPHAYHLVMCRNLFIYLHKQARATLAASLMEALAPGGRLVLGSADHVAEVSKCFMPIAPAASFAFAPKKTEARSIPSLDRRVVPQPVHVERRVAEIPRRRDDPPRTSSADDLFARAVADQRLGDLRRAERRCRQALYLEPNMLPALELLESLWKHNPNFRLRRALGERIQRQRSLEEVETA